jgi:hypothetical protein
MQCEGMFKNNFEMVQNYVSVSHSSFPHISRWLPFMSGLTLQGEFDIAMSCSGFD